MDTEPTLENLRKLCRVCLQTGEINLWEYKVTLPDHDLEGEQATADTDNASGKEIVVFEIMEELSRNKETVFDFMEMKFVCTSCLEEMITSYMFCNKLQKANEKLRRLYEGVIERGCGVQLDSTMKAEDALEVVEVTQAQDFFRKGTFVESVHVSNIEPDQEETEKKYIRKRKLMNPTIVLTNGVSQILKQLPVDLHRNDDRSAAYNSVKRIKMENSNDCLQYSNDMIRNENCAPVVETNELVEEQFSTIDEVHEEMDQLVTDNRIQPVVVDQPQPSEENDIDKVYICKYCSYAFSAPEFLRSHERKLHLCRRCPKTFSKGADLFQHLRNDHQNHTCSTCGKELSSHRNLIAHVKRMHGTIRIVGD